MVKMWRLWFLLGALGLCWAGGGEVYAAGATPQQVEQARLKRRESNATQRARENAQSASGSWWRCLGRAVADIQRHGAGGYSTSDAAHDALGRAFEWDATRNQPVFHAEGARPSFCSGAVYAALLHALVIWDSGNNPHRIGPQAWQALLPHRVADGEGPWGYANSNGPGFAVLVYRLGAGVSFTDPALARPGDFMKIWWTDAVGADERGHLVILVSDEGDSVRVWSSNQGADGAPGGFGYKTFSKASMKHVLFTRITNPAAFNNAPKVGTDPWLGSLLRRNVSWEECLQHAGAK